MHDRRTVPRQIFCINPSLFPKNFRWSPVDLLNTVIGAPDVQKEISRQSGEREFLGHECAPELAEWCVVVLRTEAAAPLSFTTDPEFPQRGSPKTI
jgi:hypothetical protein